MKISGDINGNLNQHKFAVIGVENHAERDDRNAKDFYDEVGRKVCKIEDKLECHPKMNQTFHRPVDRENAEVKQLRSKFYKEEYMTINNTN